MKKVALCLVDQESKVDTIVRDLHKIGFSNTEISVLHADSREKETHPHAHEKQPSLTQAGAVSGASVGALTGSALGLLAGLGVLSIPGIGPFIAAGPVMTTLSAMLSGTAVGSGVGLISGALIGMGIQQPEASRFEEHLKSGKILIAVESTTDRMIDSAIQVYKNAGASDIYPKT